MAKAIPDGYHSITPYLYVSRSSEAIEFYKAAFGAEEIYRLAMPDGSIAHAEIVIGTSRIMLSDENPVWGTRGPKALGGPSCGFAFYCEDSDAMFERAVKAGATVHRPVADQFYGDRSGSVVDPFGHVWTLSTHREDLTPAQMQERMNAWMAGNS